MSFRSAAEESAFHSRHRQPTFRLRRILPTCIAAALLLTPIAYATAQAAPAATQTAPQDNNPHGQVLFNRNDEDQPEQKATKKPGPPAGPEVTDTERDSLAFTAYNLDVHLAPARSAIAVHAVLTVSNIGTAPLQRLVFQLSSTLDWESFTLSRNGKVTPLTFGVHIVDTDADHTGKINEAVVTLPEPLAPGASASISTFYTGEITRSGDRLVRIGAPADQAEHADWDEIAADGTWLRGYGNVLWYPSAAAPVFLGEGATLFESVGRIRRREATAKIDLHLSVEYTGEAPDAAFFCGHRVPLRTVSDDRVLPVTRSTGIATADFSLPTLGFRTPSLFVTDRAPILTGPGSEATVSSSQATGPSSQPGGPDSEAKLIAAVTTHYDALPSYAAAAALVRPLLTDWYGEAPLRTLNILDRPGQPFEDDALLVAPLRAAEPSTLAPALAHSLAHAWFSSSHIWLDEGIAQFTGLLWTEQTQGREAAIAELQQQDNTLSLAEPAAAAPTTPNPADPSQNPGSQTSSSSSSSSPAENQPLTSQNTTENVAQSLIEARDEVFYRTKSAAVLWMLRSMVGDDSMKKILKTYRDDHQDADPKEFQRVAERLTRRDLAWFFNDWVYNDRGLPDLSIASVTPRILTDKTGKNTGWLVAVEVKNDGGPTVQVPVTVRSGTLTTTEQLRVPGHSSASIRVVFQGDPEEVIVNDGTVPEVAASSHTEQVVVH